MSGFSADWLALRAGADARARDTGLAERLKSHFAGRSALRVLDLGTGTGANLRATAPLIEDRAARARLAAACWQAAQGFARWPDTAAAVATVLREVAP